jgi:3-hydroxyisobutyrate dehydrogenase-like beta-hydroxyacid dehydrogenase
MHVIRTVGLVGLGRMGRPMARHIAANGYNVCGYDSAREGAAAAQSLGVRIEESPAGVAARSDLVIIVVGFESQVEEVLFGQGGMAEALRPDTVLAVASTVAPSYVMGLRDRLAATGVRLIDMPLSRGEAAAEGGRLLVYAGGAEADIDACRPVFTAFAEHVLRLGEVGAGQAAKAVNNMLLWTCLCANIEGMAFAERFGVDRDALREALGYGSGANWALETRADERPALWAEKDMMILLAEADKARVAMPVAGTVKEAIKAFKIARGLPMPTDDAH